MSSDPKLDPSTRNCTPATPTLSDAVALTVVVPDTLAPFAGELMLTLGAVVSAFDTVTETADEVLRLPAASRATAVNVCAPFPTVVVFQETEYGEDVSSAPRFDPSTRNCTPATPTLSDAVALTVIVPDTLAPFAGELMLTLGTVVSAFDTVTVTADEVRRLPAASRATAVSVCEPFPTVVVLHDTE